MPDGAERFSVRTVERIAAVPAAEWDRCAGGANPFVSHAFLRILEETGCTGAASGWLPRHVVLEDAGGALLGAAPLYAKGHSYGEYVFDHGWAEAYERAGGRYYPKLQGAVPFTPVPGPRLLVPAGPAQNVHRRALLAGLVQIADEMKVSSLHLTFLPEDEAEIAGQAGLLIRHGYQFHWSNAGYAGFDDFLAALASRKRKQVKKERAAIAAAGLAVRAVTGAGLARLDWDMFFRLYADTYDRKWGAPYLTRAFFDRIAAEMADRVVVMVAERDGAMVAAALNFRGRDALFGRNWGCAGEFRHLHFETCYYRALDFAIEHKLARVEAGTQGPHKIQRGYLPVRTYSAHWIRDRRFRAAVADFLDRERRAIAQDMAALAEHSPYRRSGEA